MRRKGTSGGEHSSGKGPEGGNSSGRVLGSLHLWRIRAGATRGTEQGKPAEAGHCSGEQDPAPGVWGHSVPKKPSVCSPGAGSRSGHSRIPSCPWLCSLSVSLCVPTTCLLVMPFTWRGCSQHPPTLAPEPGILPKTPSRDRCQACGPRPGQTPRKDQRGRASWQEAG